MALRQLYGIADDPERYNRPVTIYALEQGPFMVACGCGPGLLGWYSTPLDSPTITVVTKEDEKDRHRQVGYLNSQALLLHEYSHHFMMTNAPSAYPYWYVEGFAEFNANTTFEDDGSILIGYPASYRGRSLMTDSRIPMRKLLAPEIYGFGNNVDQTYGRAWLITHYLMVRPERSGQLARYLAKMASGASSLDAAKEVFGDLKTFDKELDRYIRADMTPLRIPAATASPEIRIRPMSQGEEEALMTWLAARRGISRGYNRSIGEAAEKTAAKYPDDLRVQVMAAEVGLLADRLDPADEAADRALALDGKSSKALLLKGRIATARALDASPEDKSGWAAGRPWFVKANRAEPNAAEPFYRYYTSFLFSGEQPSESAVTGLARAGVLAPESDAITMALVREDLRKGNVASARRLLIPLASSAHDRNEDNPPARIVALLDAGKVDDASAAVDKIWVDVRDGN